MMNIHQIQPVEDRLIHQGVKTKQKIDIQARQQNREIVQQSTPKINKSYFMRAKYDTFHTHYVDTEPLDEKGQLLEPPVDEYQSMNNRNWVQLSLLERNELFLNIKNAKMKRARSHKYEDETKECTFEPKITRYDPVKLSIMPLNDDMTRGKIASSLDRIMHSKYKNRDYSEIHADKIVQRSLERNMIFDPVDQNPRERKEFVDKYHKKLFIKPSEAQNSVQISSDLCFDDSSMTQRNMEPPNKIIQYLQSSKDARLKNQSENLKVHKPTKSSFSKKK